MFSSSPEDWESEEEWEDDSSTEVVDQWISPQAQWYNPDGEGLRYSLQQGFPGERESRNTTAWAFRATAAVAGPEPDSGPNIAHCGASLIKPELMNDRSADFRAIVSLGEESLREAMRTLFVPNDGLVRDDYRRNGIWGADHDEPWIVCFERMFVDESSRRQGLGRKMFYRVMDDILGRARRAGKPVLVVAMPAATEKEFQGTSFHTSLLEKIQMQKTYLAATRQFWRSLGFVRIGETMFFGWTRQVILGSSHPFAVRSEDLVRDEAIDERQGHLTRLVGLWC